MEQVTPLSRLVRIKEVLQLIGLSKTTLYKMIQEGKFPKSVSIYGSAVGWKQDEVADWINSRV
jgi:prophage regulatory protein